jgi:hypothetical protein
MMPSMRSGSLHGVTAAWLMVLLGALQTGLPSHDHPVDPAGAAAGYVLRADHHTHGVLLIEQAERLQSAPVELALLPSTVPPAELPGRFWAPAAGHTQLIRPSGRAPPPWHAPRAPPVRPYL